MEKSEKNQRKKPGEPECLNKNCWLIRSLNYTPYKRCQYCELKFRDCLFLHYQIVSLILILFFLVFSFLIEGRISVLVIVSAFTLVIVYGLFFNKSADKIIQANFAQRKANKALEELTKSLEDKIDEQTKGIKEAYKKVEKAYEVEKQTNKELKQLDKAKTLFLSIAAHQLRTPLTGIKGYISMFLEGDFGPLAKKQIEIMKGVFYSSNRLTRLINTFLNISRIESGRLRLDKLPVDLKELSQTVLADLKEVADDKNIKLELDAPEKIDQAFIDKDKIEDVLLNLVDNAIKYTQTGQVILRLRQLDGKIRVEVQDTGIGISKQESSELFNKFVRGKQALKLHTDGSGLGLFIVKKLIEAHNGQVGVESAGAGKGSIFWFEVPIG